MIRGISHIALIVKDLERTVAFLQTIFDAKAVLPFRGDVFFLINDVWLCIMKGEELTERTYNHIAFQIPDEDYEYYKEKVIVSGAELLPARPRVDGEGRSIYFYDFDSHLFELHTGSLEERLKRYSK